MQMMTLKVPILVFQIDQALLNNGVGSKCFLSDLFDLLNPRYAFIKHYSPIADNDEVCSVNRAFGDLNLRARSFQNLFVKRVLRICFLLFIVTFLEVFPQTGTFLILNHWSGPGLVQIIVLFTLLDIRAWSSVISTGTALICKKKLQCSLSFFEIWGV